MEIASQKDIARFQMEADKFMKEPWQSMFQYAPSKLAIMEFLAYKEEKTIYQCHFDKFNKLNQ